MKQLFAGLWDQKVPDQVAGREARPQRLLWGSPGRGLGPWVLLGGKVVVARTSHPRTGIFCSPLPGRQLAVEVKCSLLMRVGYLGISVVCVCVLGGVPVHAYTSMRACVCPCLCVRACLCGGRFVCQPGCVCVCLCLCALDPVYILRGLCVFQLGHVCLHACLCV